MLVRYGVPILAPLGGARPAAFAGRWAISGRVMSLSATFFLKRAMTARLGGAPQPRRAHGLGRAGGSPRSRLTPRHRAPCPCCRPPAPCARAGRAGTARFPWSPRSGIARPFCQLARGPQRAERVGAPWQAEAVRARCMPRRVRGARQHRAGCACDGRRVSHPWPQTLRPA